MFVHNAVEELFERQLSLMEQNLYENVNCKKVAVVDSKVCMCLDMYQGPVDISFSVLTCINQGL